MDFDFIKKRELGGFTAKSFLPPQKQEKIMASTKRLQNKCKKCGYTWYPRGKNISLKCPSCGSSEVGYAGTGIGVIVLIFIAVMVFGGSKKEAPIQASSAQLAHAEVSATSGEIATHPASTSERKGEPTNVDDVSIVPGRADEKAESPSTITECGVDNEDKPLKCSTDECTSDASDDKCQLKRAHQNELY